MTSSLQLVFFSLMAIGLCEARPSPLQTERHLLSIISPGPSLESIVSSLHQSSYPSSSSSSSSSGSAHNQAVLDSLSLPSSPSVWSDEEENLTRGIGNSRQSDRLPFLPDAYSVDSGPDDEMTEPISADHLTAYPSGLDAVAMDRLKNVLVSLTRHLGSGVVTTSGGSLFRAKKGYRPSGFLGSRGKRLFPGFHSLLLAKYYKDAAKWKRQPHVGFHGSRG